MLRLCELPIIALAETLAGVNVAAAEYQRLPGYPRDYTIDGRAAEPAEQARDWHARQAVAVAVAAQLSDL